ncbi:hypothetical protein [Rhodoferax sp.]|uniref:hypothetical protein n=1 Tax=Rhodoferax sp. TaxID=50421 RepID=UPI0039B90B24
MDKTQSASVDAGRLNFERIKADEERRKKLIPFEWKELPRVAWLHGDTHPKGFDGWPVPQTNGRKVSVHAFHQEFIYAGHVMGMPNEPTRYLVEAIGRAEKLCPHVKCSPVVLSPALYWGRTERVTDGKDTSYDWMTLPRVRCIAELFSTTAARAIDEPFSSLVVIWFQDHFGMPDAGVQKRLADLDWKTLAVDWCP